MSSDPSHSLEDLKRDSKVLKAAVHCHLCPAGEGAERGAVIMQPGLHPVCTTCLNSHISSSSSSSTSITTNCLRCQGMAWEGVMRTLTPNEILQHKFHLGCLQEINKKITSLTRSSVVEKCDACDPFNKKNASVRCLDCKQNLCEDCNIVHTKFWNSHNSPDILLPLDLNQNSSSSSSSPHSFPPPNMCLEHSSKELDMMCLDCKVPICTFCLTKGSHKGHDFSDIEGIASERREKLSGLVDSVEDRHRDLDKSLSLIDLMETKIQESLISQKTKILKEMEDKRIKAIQQINQKQEELLNELETKSNKKLERLTQQRKRLEADQSCLENSVRVSQFFLKNASDVDLSVQFHLLSDQLTRLKEDKNLLQIPVETKITGLGEVKLIDLDDLLKGIKLKEDDGIGSDLFSATTNQEVELFLARGDDLEEEKSISVQGGNALVTPLISSIKRGNKQVFLSILQHGAHPEHSPQYKWKPIHWACAHGHLEMLKHLLDLGIDKETKDEQGSTPLIKASYYGKVDVVQHLISIECDLNVRTRGGWSALMKASEQGHVEVVKILLAHGADTQIENHIGERAIELTQSQEIKDLLQEHESKKP